MNRQDTRRMRGQSTLEYVLIMAAVLAAVIAASVAFSTKAQSTIDKSGEAVGSAADKIKTGLGF